MRLSGTGTYFQKRPRDYRNDASPEGTEASNACALSSGALQSRSLSIELQCRLQERPGGRLGRVGSIGIVAQLRAVHDAGVVVGERPLGLGVDEEPARPLVDGAIAHALIGGRDRGGLCAERAVEGM